MKSGHKWKYWDNLTKSWNRCTMGQFGDHVSKSRDNIYVWNILANRDKYGKIGTNLGNRTYFMYVSQSYLVRTLVSTRARVGGRTRAPLWGRFRGSTTGPLASLWLVKMPSWGRYTSEWMNEFYFLNCIYMYTLYKCFYLQYIIMFILRNLRSSKV